jgi:hypothetical protein
VEIPQDNIPLLEVALAKEGTAREVPTQEIFFDFLEASKPSGTRPLSLKASLSRTKI